MKASICCAEKNARAYHDDMGTVVVSIQLIEIDVKDLDIFTASPVAPVTK